jgi:type I site-specific restriction endonuclease
LKWVAKSPGKTHVAFWTIWKLCQSGLIRRVLYISDRIVLRDQAYNWFGPFGDARAIIGEGKIPSARAELSANSTSLQKMKKLLGKIFFHWKRGTQRKLFTTRFQNRARFVGFNL